MDYAKLRSEIRGPVVPVPLVLRNDLSIDHDGLQRYTDWLISRGMKAFCLTFMYSMLDFITTEELLDLTRTIAAAIARRGIFISCTAGGPLNKVIKTVNAMKDAGADAVMVHPTEFMLQHGDYGTLYVDYVGAVAAQTDVPILICVLPKIGQIQAAVTDDHFRRLIAYDNFIGFKCDFYQTPYRAAIARQFGDRLCIIGGGMISQYFLAHHYPNQAEFAGMWDPSRAKRLFELLDQNDYAAALMMVEEEAAAAYEPPGLEGNASVPVILYAMGFAETYLARPPQPSPSREQAQAMIDHMRKHRHLFECPGDDFRDA